MLGPTLVAMQPFVMWAMQPGAARVSVSPIAYHIVTFMLGGLALSSEVLRLRGMRPSTRAHHS
jgi:hypothetical protein